MIILILIVALVATIFIFMQQAKFGKVPTGERLERIKKSPNYRDGKFQNQSFTPNLKEGVSYFTVVKDFFFNKSKRSKPETILPLVVFLNNDFLYKHWWQKIK